MTTAAPPAHEGAERRAERRMRTLKTAKIAFNLGHSVFDCTVRNMSANGALLEVQNSVCVPQEFEIVMDQGATRRPCSVRWRTERLIGVKFTDAGKKAA